MAERREDARDPLNLIRLEPAEGGQEDGRFPPSSMEPLPWLTGLPRTKSA